MRIFIAVLVLIFSFQSLTKADDISDFQIEGMSVGDSLLDYFSKKELINGIRKNSYKGSDGKFIDINLKANWFDLYESIQATVKRNDNKYIAHSIDGGIFFERNTKLCMDRMEEIVDDLSKIFDETKFQKLTNNTHASDPSGKSSVYGYSVFLENGSISVYCYLWDASMGVENYVAVSTKNDEFNDWLLNLYN